MANAPLNQFSRKAYQDMQSGLVSRPAADQIPASAFHQLDNAILADHDILEKAPGYALDGSPFPNAAASFIRMLVNYRAGAAINTLVVAALDAGNTNTSYKVDLKNTVGDGNYNYIGYTVGTATFTNGSAVVTGSGTAWDLHLKAGDKIKPDSKTVWYEIQSVDSATQVTLVSTFAQTTSAAATYVARMILSINSLPVGLVFNNKLIIANGVEAMQEWDNTTMLLLQDSDAPFAALLEKHKARVFAAREPDAPSDLTWSKPNDHTIWDATSRLPVFPNDGGFIVQIKSFANSMIVFKDNGLVYQVLGEFDQDVIGAPSLVRKIDTPDNVGIISGRSVTINQDNRLYFLAETGIYTIDRNMHVDKISWDIEPDIKNLIFRGSPATSKQFIFDTVPQWNSGTHAGTHATSAGLLSNFMDRYSFTLPSIYNRSIATAIGADNVTGTCVSYLKSDGTSTFRNTVAYIRHDVSGTQTIEDAATYSNITSNNIAIAEASIAIAANGNVGVAYDKHKTATSHDFNFVERTQVGTATFTNNSNIVTGSGTQWSLLNTGSRIKKSTDSTFYTVLTVNSDTSVVLSAPYPGTTESSGYIAWSAPRTLASPSTSTLHCSVSIKYSINEPRIVFVTDSPTLFFTRSAGAFSTTTLSEQYPVIDERNFLETSLCSDGTNVGVAIVRREGNSVSSFNSLRCYPSTDGGASFGANFSAGVFDAMFAGSGIQLAVNGAGEYLAAYINGGSGKLFTINFTTGSIVEINASGPMGGYVFYNSNGYFKTRVPGGPYDKYITPSTTVSETSFFTAFDEVSCGMANNGAVFAVAAMGVNIGEVVVRRLSFDSTWTSDVDSDSTLTSWGTYDVTSEISNGATITHKIALGATSSLGTPNPITSGTIITTDSSKVFFRVTVRMVITSLSPATIESIVLNYFGTGVDAKFPVGFVFNNEYYLAASRTGASSNDTVIFLDRKDAWGMWLPAISAMAAMNQNFYGGSSTSGKVYKLKQGYSFAGSAYSLTAVTKEDLLGSLELEKEVYKVYVKFIVKNSGAFTFSYRLDNFKSQVDLPWVDKVIDQTKDGVAEIEIGRKCRSIQFKVSQDDADVQVSFDGFVIMYAYLFVR